MKKVTRLAVSDTERCVGCQLCMFACSRRVNVVGLESSCIKVRSVGGMERGFVVVVCRACPNPPCAKVCPTDALKPRPGGGVILNKDLCTGCGKCREACLIGAVFWDESQSKPLICVHCGFCVNFCPHSVLEVEKEENA